MTDVHSPEIRSFNMSRIRAKDTKPEIVVRKALFSRGLRFRLHHTQLPGRPDIVLPKYKTAIFIHGCFWHGHESCSKFKIPKTRTEWWTNKINQTIERGDKVKKSLEEKGWNVLILWECSLDDSNIEEAVHAIRNNLKNCKDLR